MKSKTMYLSLLALGVSLAGPTLAANGPGPKDFSPICTLDENCAVEGNALVAFGSQGQYTYRTMRGSFICDGKTFGVSKPSPEAACLTLNKGPTSSASSSSGAAVKEAAPVPAGAYALVSRSSGMALTVSQGASANGAAVAQSDLAESPSQIWHIKQAEDGFYALIASHSGKALDVQDLPVSDGARLQQFPWMNNLTQHWLLEPVGDGYYRIVSRFSGKVVDVYELNRRNGGEVRTWTYWGGENQHWRLVPVKPPAKKK